MNRDHMMGHMPPVPKLGEKRESIPVPPEMLYAAYRRRRASYDFEHGDHSIVDDSLDAQMPQHRRGPRALRWVADNETTCATYKPEQDPSFCVRAEPVAAPAPQDDVPPPDTGEWAAKGLLAVSWPPTDWPFPHLGRWTQCDLKRDEFNFYLQTIAQRMGVRNEASMSAVLRLEINRCARSLGDYEEKYERLQAEIENLGALVTHAQVDAEAAPFIIAPKV